MIVLLLIAVVWIGSQFSACSSERGERNAAARWATGPVTEETVREALGDKKGRTIKVSGGLVAINDYSESIISEDHEVQYAGIEAREVWSVLFSNPKVTRVTYSRSADLVDTYGHGTEKRLLLLALNRGIAEKIDWDGLESRGWSASYDVANYTIDPVLALGLTSGVRTSIP